MLSSNLCLQRRSTVVLGQLRFDISKCVLLLHWLDIRQIGELVLDVGVCWMRRIILQEDLGIEIRFATYWCS